MSSKYLRKWLTTYDPIGLGWSPAGIANGLCATNGFFFPRVRGGYNLYRTVAGAGASEPELVGAAGADAVRIQTFPWVRHAAGTEYSYRLVPVGGGGVENWMDKTVTSVRFTETGLWAGPLPNAPTDLHVLPLGNGRLAIRWSYCPQDQQIAPAGFSVYRDNEAGEIDYGTTEADVRYRPGQVYYEYVSLPQPDGSRSHWAVRAYVELNREEQNLNRAFAVARAAGPPANPAVSVQVI